MFGSDGRVAYEPRSLSGLRTHLPGVFQGAHVSPVAAPLSGAGPRRDTEVGRSRRTPGHGARLGPEGGAASVWRRRLWAEQGLAVEQRHGRGGCREGRCAERGAGRGTR